MAPSLHRGGAEICFSRTPITEVSTLETEWRALDTAGPVFTSWEWIGTWLATLPQEIRPEVLRAERGGVTVAMAGLVPTRRRGLIRGRALHLNATGDPRWDCIEIEHNGLIGAAAIDGVLLSALLYWFRTEVADAVELRLGGIAETLSAEIIDDAGLLAETIRGSRGFAVDLRRVTAAGAEIGGWLGRDARQQLRRRLRDYEQRGGLAVREAQSADEALEFFAALKTLHVASWDRRRRRHAFAEPYFETFHRALIARTFAAGTVQLLRVAAGNEVVSYLYNLRRGKRVSSYQSGFADADRKLSPGLVSHYLALLHNAAAGAEIYDFLGGENRLKTRFATESYRLTWQSLRQPTLGFRLEAAARRLKRRLTGASPQ